MERRGAAVEPREIMQEGDAGLRITWADGYACHYTAAALRLNRSVAGSHDGPYTSACAAEIKQIWFTGAPQCGGACVLDSRAGALA